MKEELSRTRAMLAKEEFFDLHTEAFKSVALSESLESVALQLGLAWPCKTSAILQNIVRLQQDNVKLKRG